ncbi:MAG: SDR family oxidoreductase [Parvibaculaceae bacterium]|nr:SDR family oxidoreductase [Parvibaculaceae bacterium]
MKKVALITGGGRGIGAATAKLAAQSGYDVCFSYVSNDEAAARVVAACEAEGAQALAVKSDVARSDEVTTLFEACDARFGRLDLLVNNAGIIGAASSVSKLPDDVLKRTFEVNVFGAFYCARAAIPRMALSAGGTGGVIINISSMAARIGSAHEYVHYAASKGALDSFTIGLSKELGRDGIRVNGIHAGTADTEIHTLSGNPDRPQMVADTSPLGRVGLPLDMAEAVVWLASPKADYITGATLSVSGGL